MPRNYAGSVISVMLVGRLLDHSCEDTLITAMFAGESCQLEPKPSSTCAAIVEPKSLGPVLQTMSR